MRDMRKVLSFILVLALILTSFTAVFAADSQTPADVKDTEYEAAVTALIEKGIISGYTDGTFRPDGTITRAEACVVVVKAMAPGEDALEAVSASSFSDLAGFDWAAKYINYAAAKGIISGYPDGTFRPANQVTYAEMASMLVRALGYSAGDLTGNWPDNFITKAATLGIFTDIDHKVNDVNAPAVRGHVAFMTYRVADDIANANKPGETTDPGDGEPGDSEDPAGYLSDFSGRAYGILLSVAKVLNEKGDAVDEFEFLIGSKTLYLKTNGKFDAPLQGDIEGNLNKGNIYGLQMRDGVVIRFGTSDDDFSGLGSTPAGFENFTGGSWWVVESASNYGVEIRKPDAENTVFCSILEDASIYVAEIEKNKITGYKPGTFRDIKAGKLVRLYSVTGDDPGVAEIVLVGEFKEFGDKS
jgi:hypothetical protein